MTAKEKARELYGLYEFVHIQNYTSPSEVVDCAIIAVNEIIMALHGFGSETDELQNMDNAFRFWDSVIEELEKLRR